MRGIWQIFIGSIMTLWQFAQPNHGFWHRQTGYHDYNPNWVYPTVNTLTTLIYAIGAGLFCFGIYRLLKAPSRRYQRVA